ncbi:DAO-domain-containing protein [Sistotremastrum niveocremeum HHB9708]|uniref:Glycerol-3-phosphate dehydrogenase n=1 Tax=Sistotremastrum niveocremeum HHB9708 TaxID=1314777 RepID=A0A164ZQK9_9AGAM|nr:DAO-domain-containing protein [Sistotremastrum niveocremeum HHB9708]
MFRTSARRALAVTGGLAVAVGGGSYLLTSKSTTPFPKVQSRRPPPSWTPPSRQSMIDDIKKTDEYDLLIIGGGATGAGVAVDAASRGLKVALVDRDDFSSGTSSKSTKLVHGGVRYLQKAVFELDYEQYKLVREALHERKIFLQTAPYLSSPLPIMLPIYKYWQMPYYWAGCKMYDVLAGGENMESSYLMSRGKALEAFPMLKSDGLVGAVVYYDGQHNDSRMNVALILTAVKQGATVLNHAGVTQLHKGSNGRLEGATVVDNLTGEALNIKAKGIINATGAFSDAMLALASGHPELHKPIVQPSSGVHVTLPNYYSPGTLGLIDPQTSDGRVIFFLPWQGNTIAGTTDTPSPVERDPAPREEDIQWVLEEIRTYLAPDIKVRRGDVLSAWSGLRPLVRDPNSTKTGTEGLVRNHLINVSPEGLLTIAGGKWTTYRAMAAETVDAAIKEFALQDRMKGDGSCVTEHLRLVGSDGWTPNMFISLIQRFGIETEVAKHLAADYGDRAWAVCAYARPTNERWPLHGIKLSPQYPYIEAEVRYAVHNEFAQTAVDFLSRRSRLSFLNVQAALDALPRVIDIMAEELHWSRRRKKQEYNQALTHFKSMGLQNIVVEPESWKEWVGRTLHFSDPRKTVTRTGRAVFAPGELDSIKSAFHIHAKPSTIEGKNDQQLRLDSSELREAVTQLKSFEAITQKQIGYVLREAGFEGRPEVDIDEFVEICSTLKEVNQLPPPSSTGKPQRTRIPVEKSGGGV